MHEYSNVGGNRDFKNEKNRPKMFYAPTMYDTIKKPSLS